MSSVVEQIKERLNIVEVVGSYLKLQKAGSNYKALCPFHNERTPSFFVSPGRQSFYCFGCNRGGDVLSFIENIEGIDFIGALKILADRAGVTLRQESFAPDRRKEKLYQVLEAAQSFFSDELWRSSPVLGYLDRRGVSQETLKKFDLGFAPASWRGLYDSLSSRGFAPALMEQAGLIVAAPRSAGASHYYDRFRNRIVFPLADSIGRVVGFSGRLFEGVAGPPSGEGKYVNTPETVLYDKSRILYGYDKAKLAISREGYAVLVEGQFDLLLSHQAGVTNAVAVSGTALTVSHLETVRRLTRNIVMAFDGDLAGISAARRAIELAFSLGLEVRAALLPADTDPGDLAGREPERWRTLVADARHVIDFCLETLARRLTDRRQLARVVHEEIYPYLLKLQSRLEQAHFIGRIAELTRLNPEVVQTDFNEFSRAAKSSSPSATPPEDFLVQQERESRREKIIAKLIGMWWWLEGPAGNLPVRNDLTRRLEEILGQEGLAAQAQSLEPRRSQLILEAELHCGDDDSGQAQRLIDDLLLNLERELLKTELQESLARLAEAERLRSGETIANCLKQCQDISRRLDRLPGRV